MKLTRDDVLRHAKNRPLHQLSFRHLRVPMKSFHAANVVSVHEGGKVAILKDRNGVYLDLPRENGTGLVDEAEMEAVTKSSRTEEI